MIGAVIQARMNSSRLPGKILMDICGKPVLELLIERLKQSKHIEKIVLATTINDNDDPVEQLAVSCGIDYLRGSEDDVLDRYYQSAKVFGLTHILRMTGDCPLCDPIIIDNLVEKYYDFNEKKNRYDYLSNTLKPSFPDGIDAEIFSLEVLEKLNEKSDKKYQREHVCTYLVENPNEFSIKNIEQDVDQSNYRLTLDNQEDFDLIQAIFQEFYPKGKMFYLKDIIQFLENNPELVSLNKNLKRNEGFIASLEDEDLSDEQKKEIIDNVLDKKKLHEV